MFQQILKVDHNNSIPDNEKLEIFYKQKKYIEDTKPFNDSAYVFVLLKISKYEFAARDNYPVSITAADNALNIAKGLKKEPFITLTVNCYYNLASSYQKLMLYKKALAYYDTVLLLCDKKFTDTSFFKMDALYNTTDMEFFLGDYQKVIDESNKGIELSIFEKDSLNLAFFLNRKAQSLSYINYLDEAFINVSSAIRIAEKKDEFELATSYKTLGFIYEKRNIFDSAKYFFTKSIKVRNTTKYYDQVANDYIDLGNFYLNSLNNYSNAQRCYSQALFYANKIDYNIDRNLKLALANMNLGETFLIQQKFKQANDFFLKSFNNLRINLYNNLKNNPTSIQLSKISNKDLVIVLMNDKTNILLQQYKINYDKTFLTACLQSAIVTDSVITQIRHEQLGEQSKLYWRDKTRDFYTNALEACYLADNATLAFFFMEKSRAALLNDRLNELGASAYLSPADAAKQENYQIKIVELEQRLGTAEETSKEFKNIEQQLLDAKNDFEQYIKSLEIKYPAYYQYKYADEVASLQQLQFFLRNNNQSFVHYFMGDSATFILAITSSQTKLFRLFQNNFKKEQLSTFLQLCANKEKLNNNYNSFAQLSHSIYTAIFQPLQLPKGRVIICADNIIIPFDALCKDEKGKNFLLNDYSFSYVYSARYLINPFKNTKPAGNFLGFAPVSFAPYLNVPDLKNAANALRSLATAYHSNKLFTYQNATRNNFFKYASSYSIVSIFSHARADTTNNEPVLYMQDSVIHLSELKLLDKPATKLVLLSACQTNVGKAATGEGIYSLARGFATAGIPSVAATLWKADEQTIYSVSEKFNEYLSQGISKDEALQKAKLYFIQNNGNSEKLLPYYWANMILIGNTDAIEPTASYKNYWWWIAVGVLFIIAFIFFYSKKHKSRNSFKFQEEL